MQSLKLPFAMTCALLVACGAKNTESNVQPPGADASAKTRSSRRGRLHFRTSPRSKRSMPIWMGFTSITATCRGRWKRTTIAPILNDDVIQCVIYDGNVKDAKIMGVEYIVSAKLFQGLPEAEKAMWHSHVHEVKSGQLIAPGIPQVAEHELMKKLIGTYGKTWHTWHTDLRKELPIGVPQLMMGFTADGQHDPQMVAARDQRFGIASADKRANRDDIARPPIDPGADAWLKGRIVQITDPTGIEHASPHGAKSAASPPSNAMAASASAPPTK